MPGDVRCRTSNPDLLLGLVEADDVHVSDAPPALTARLDRLLEERRDPGFPPDDVRKGVRDLLRRSGFKPTGRNKPASEYLARAAEEGTFPRINNLVDACNLASLESGIPISLLDLDRAMEGTKALEVREGREGETFVFNRAGQAIDVQGLVSVARVGGATIGNPVKDSMLTKTTPDSRNVLALLYATSRVWSEGEVRDAARGLGDLLRAHGGAKQVHAWVLTTGS